MKRIIVGITGASGSILGLLVVKELLKLGHTVNLVITDLGEQVMAYELEEDFEVILTSLKSDNLIVHNNKNMFGSIASGSYPIDSMVIVPASMSTVAKISHGTNDNLLTRAADVTIKEKRRLVIVPRETPLSTIHLENLCSLSKMGVHIVPPIPAFYQRPKGLEDVLNHMIGRIIRSLDVENDLYTKWGENKEQGV